MKSTQRVEQSVSGVRRWLSSALPAAAFGVFGVVALCGAAAPAFADRAAAVQVHDQELDRIAVGRVARTREGVATGLFSVPRNHTVRVGVVHLGERGVPNARVRVLNRQGKVVAAKRGRITTTAPLVFDVTNDQINELGVPVARVEVDFGPDAFAIDNCPVHVTVQTLDGNEGVGPIIPCGPINPCFLAGTPFRDEVVGMCLRRAFKVRE